MVLVTMPSIGTGQMKTHDFPNGDGVNTFDVAVEEIHSYLMEKHEIFKGYGKEAMFMRWANFLKDLSNDYKRLKNENNNNGNLW